MARGLRLVITLSMWAVIWTARQLDYARPFRPEAHYECAHVASSCQCYAMLIDSSGSYTKSLSIAYGAVVEHAP